MAKKLVGLLGDKFAQMPQRAAEMKQGLLAAPSQLAEMFSPEFAQRMKQGAERGKSTPADPQQWIDAGMNLTGMAPISGAIGTFIGKGAKTWDAGKAAQAEELLDKGVDPRAAHAQTGIMPGVDRALRREISDDAATIKQFPTGPMNPISAKLGDILDHPDVYKAYPDLANMPVTLKSNATGKSTGAFYPDVNRISYDAKNPEAAKSGLLHEMQHVIQQREGWASGGNPEIMRGLMGGDELANLYSQRELNNAYRSLAGEAEARLTQARMNMTMPERLQSYPPDMFDVPAKQQIIRRTPRPVK